MTSSSGTNFVSGEFKFSYRVFKDGTWFFPWAFCVYDVDGDFVYGEHHIETRRTATKDAEDMVARLSDGRNVIGHGGGIIHVR